MPDVSGSYRPRFRAVEGLGSGICEVECSKPSNAQPKLYSQTKPFQTLPQTLKHSKLLQNSITPLKTLSEQTKRTLKKLNALTLNPKHRFRV